MLRFGEIKITKEKLYAAKKSNPAKKMRTVLSIDSFLVYENKYYLQVYLTNCSYNIIDNQMID